MVEQPTSLSPPLVCVAERIIIMGLGKTLWKIATEFV